MLLLDTRLLIVTSLFFSVIFVDYLRNKKLPLLSNKCFTLMLYFTAVNLVFNMLKIYTIVHADVVTPQVSRFCNQVFYFTLILVVVALYWYVEILGNKQKRTRPKKAVLPMLPLFLAAYMMLTGELHYSFDENQIYASGSMATAFELTVLFYCLLTIWSTHIHKDTVARENRLAIRAGIVLLMASSVIQFFNLGLLLSSLAVTVMILFIYLAFENPKEYMDEDTGNFNKRAFHLMLEEKKEAGKPLILISVVIDDLARIQALMGHENTNQVLAVIGARINEIFLSFQLSLDKIMPTECRPSRRQMKKIIKHGFLSSVYHSRSNVITAISELPLVCIEDQLNELSRMIKEPVSFQNYSVALKAHIDVIFTEVYQQQDSCDEIYEMMNYMAAHNHATADTNLYFLDQDIIDRKQRDNTIEALVRQAIEGDGFDIVYQPIYHTDAGRFLSAEALVRLADTETVGFVSPEEFIPIAEKKGLIMELGEIVFEKVCAFAGQEQLLERGIQYIEVNLSGIQCVHPDLPGQLEEIMKKYAIPPDFINLEITETALVESGEMLQVNMQHLRNMGCSISMDDFGTGYSNLSRMAEVVYDLVKLDKSLIWPCFNEENPKANAILESVIRMLNLLGVNIVAEGVETKEMADYLDDHGVTHLQGYYYSRPISEAAYMAFLDGAEDAAGKSDHLVRPDPEIAEEAAQRTEAAAQRTEAAI